MVLRTPNNWGKIAAGQAFNGPVQTSESLDPWQSCARRRPNVGRFRIMPFRDDVLQGGYCWAFRDEPTGPCWSPWPGWSLVLFCFFLTCIGHGVIAWNKAFPCALLCLVLALVAQLGAVLVFSSDLARM